MPGVVYLVRVDADRWLVDGADLDHVLAVHAAVDMLSYAGGLLQDRDVDSVAIALRGTGVTVTLVDPFAAPVSTLSMYVRVPLPLAESESA